MEHLRVSSQIANYKKTTVSKFTSKNSQTSGNGYIFTKILIFLLKISRLQLFYLSEPLKLWLIFWMQPWLKFFMTSLSHGGDFFGDLEK